MKDILKALHERPIAYYPIYKRVTGSTTAGILLSQLMYWWAKVDGRTFYKTDAEIYEETALAERELKTAKALLREFDFVRIFLAGNPARTHYEIFEDKLIEQIRQTSLAETSKQERTKRPNKEGRNGQTLYTENTQKNTQESEPAHAQFLVTSISLETIPFVEENVAPGVALAESWEQAAEHIIKIVEADNFRLQSHLKGNRALPPDWKEKVKERMRYFQGKGEWYLITVPSALSGKLFKWEAQMCVKVAQWIDSPYNTPAQQRLGTQQPATSAGFSLNQYKPKQ